MESIWSTKWSCGAVSSKLMERGHPVRQRAQHAPSLGQRMFALRAQADSMSAIRNRDALSSLCFCRWKENHRLKSVPLI